MIRDITIGQYYPVESVVHKLDPRVKIVATSLYVVSLFVFDSLVEYILLIGTLAAIIKLCKVPIGHILKGLKPVLFLLIFTIVLNTILTKGDHMIFEWAFIHISREGMVNAAFLTIRLVLLIMGSSLMTFTTTPNELTDGLEKLFRPLRLIKVPVHEMAMMMSIALRFIPILIEETDKIMKAQMARGADFESGNIITKAKALVPILVPLFVSAFRRATDLAMAMEARCYQGGDSRTKMKPLKYKRNDFVSYTVMVAFVVVLVVV